MKLDRREILGPELPGSMTPLLHLGEECLGAAMAVLQLGKQLPLAVLYIRPGAPPEEELIYWDDDAEKARKREAARERARATGACAMLIVSDCFYLDAKTAAADPAERPRDSEHRKEQVVVEIFTPTHNASWTWSYERRPERPRLSDRILPGARRLLSMAKGGAAWDPWPPKLDA